jgi:hypothetical protein
MKTRMASKYLDVPFLVAAEILDELPTVAKEAVKMAVDAVRDSKHRVAADRNAPTIAGRIAAIIEENSTRKLAIDSDAASYWEAYYGPYGKELVKEVKKRVRADLAGKWMHRNGVDQAAADYWSKYFGAYGSDWVKEVPKRISPSKK